MTIHFNEIIEALALFCEDKKFRASSKECLKGGLITGVAAVLAGFLFGRVGLALGGALGGLGASCLASDFQSVGSILKDMPYALKQKLADNFAMAFRDFGIDDVVTLSMMLTSNSSFQAIALKEVTNFLNNELNMRMQT